MLAARAITQTALACLAPAIAAQGAGPQAPERTFEARLAKHPYFSKIAYERVATHAPYLFLVQTVAGAATSRAEGLATRYVSLLDPALELFEREITMPLGLEQRADHEFFVVALLATRGDLENYQRVTKEAWHLGASGHFDPALEAVVVSEDPFEPGQVEYMRKVSARHLILHACQEAWSAEHHPALVDSWFLEGLADVLARATEPGDATPIDSRALRAFVEAAEDQHRAWTELRSLEELSFVGEPRRLDFLFRKRYPQELRPADQGDAWWTFYRQSALLVHFLWAADGARLRPALVAFYGKDRAGRHDWASLCASLPSGTGGAELERDFLKWIVSEHRARLPGIAFDAEMVARALGRPAAPADGGGDPEPAPDLAEPEPAPIVLDLVDATPEERLAMALHALGLGLTKSAMEDLERLAGEPLDAALHERVLRERGRATAWIARRDAHLAALVSGATPLDFTLAGKKLRAKVRALEGGELLLDQNRAGIERLAIEALDPLELAQQMKPSGAADDWARMIPYVLRGDGRATKLLKADGGQGGALLADARDDYPARLRLGDACARLQTIAAEGKARSPADLDERLSRLHALLGECGDLPLIARKRPALRARATELLGQRIDMQGPQTLLAGRFEVLEGDRVRLTYAFDDARELGDFSAEPYAVVVRKGFTPVGVASQPFRIEDGQIVAAGQACLRSLVDLGAPLSMEYGLEYLDTGHRDRSDSMAAGMCDDGQEHFLWALNHSALQRHAAGDFGAGEGSIGATFMDTSYAMELRHDGSEVSLSCEGKEILRLGAGKLVYGAFFLLANCSNSVRIDRLVVEGRLRPDSFARLRQAWIESELAKY